MLIKLASGCGVESAVRTKFNLKTTDMEKIETPNGRNYKLRIFGWNIYITKNTLRNRNKRGKQRHDNRNLRWQMCGQKCECCGKEIPLFGYPVHTLPKGEPRRNEVENIRIFCKECYHDLQKKPHITAIEYMNKYGKEERKD